MLDPRQDSQYRRSIAKQTQDQDVSNVVKRKRSVKLGHLNLPEGNMNQAVQHAPALPAQEVEFPVCLMVGCFLLAYSLLSSHQLIVQTQTLRSLISDDEIPPQRRTISGL